MDYNFLRNIRIVDKRGRMMSSPLVGLTIRLHRNGYIEPSEELVAKFNLEFQNKDSDSGNGAQFFSSKDWEPLRDAEQFIIVAFVPRVEGRLHAFNICRYHESGEPKSSVLSQKSKCDELYELVKDVFEKDEQREFVDLEVKVEYPIVTENNLYFLPWTIAKGTNAGKEDYVRRENIEMFPLELLLFKKEVPNVLETSNPNV